MSDAHPQLSNNPFNAPVAPAEFSQDMPIKDESTKYIVLCILELVFCGGMFAIIPLIFAFQYKDAVVARDVAGAMQARRKVRKALVAILVLAIVSVGLSILLLAQSGFFDVLAQNYQAAQTQ